MLLSSSSLGQRETLNCKETVLFQAALQWAASECKRRQLDVSPQHCRLVLGDALYLIRLPTMALEDFANEAATSGVLTLQVTTPTRPRPQPHTRRTPRKLERVLFSSPKRRRVWFVCLFARFLGDDRHLFVLYGAQQAVAAVQLPGARRPQAANLPPLPVVGLSQQSGTPQRPRPPGHAPFPMPRPRTVDKSVVSNQPESNTHWKSKEPIMDIPSDPVKALKSRLETQCNHL